MQIATFARADAAARSTLDTAHTRSGARLAAAAFAGNDDTFDESMTFDGMGLVRELDKDGDGG